jgi:hypothetical protein
VISRIGTFGSNDIFNDKLSTRAIILSSYIVHFLKCLDNAMTCEI